MGGRSRRETTKNSPSRPCVREQELPWVIRMSALCFSFLSLMQDLHHAGNGLIAFRTLIYCFL